MELELIHDYYEDVRDKYKAGADNEISTKKLRSTLIQLDEMYSEGYKTPLTDEEYDALYQIYLDLTEEVIRGDTDKKKIKHDYPLLKGTLKKVHYITKKEKDEDPNSIEAHKALYEWYISTYEKLDKNKNHYLGFWFKYDGCSVILSLTEDRAIKRAITRGEEDIGLDKSSLFKSMKLLGVIPDEFEGEVGLKTEIIMPNSLFDKYNKLFASDKPFATPRNAIASLLASDEFTKFHREFIRIKPLLMCYEGKFRSFTLDDDDNGPVYSVPYNHKLSEEEMGAIIKDVHEKIEESDYACDGVVVRWYDEDAMESLGRDEHNYVNNFEIAYKFPRAHQYSKLIDIEQDIGLMGKLSLTAVFEPVVFDNRVVTHASLGSYERAKKLNLAIGDTVGIQYEIVPYLYLDDFCNENRSGNEPIKLLDKCPYCGSTLELNPELSCVNKDCPSRIQGKIYTFCERAGIAGVGESVIETLFHQKLVTKIEDLFSLKDHKEEFCAIEGMGEKTFKKICKQFDSLELTEAQILSCVGIKSIGPKKSNKISDIYYINELLEVCSEPEDVALREMVNDGITLNLATILYEGVNENANLIMFLMNHVDVAKRKDETGEVVFTGFRNPKFQKHLLENYNLEVSTGVNKKTVLVIARDPLSDSGKLRKARDYNIPVISVPEAYEYYKFKI